MMLSENRWGCVGDGIEPSNDRFATATFSIRAVGPSPRRRRRLSHHQHIWKARDRIAYRTPKIAGGQLFMMASRDRLVSISPLNAQLWAAGCWMFPIVASEHQDPNKLVKDKTFIFNALILHSENGGEGKLASFDSKRLPPWWDQCCRSYTLDSRFEYWVDKKYVGQPLTSVPFAPSLVVRSGARNGPHSPN